MTIRRATVADASSLAAISLEVWLNTYIRDGVNAFFADYALEHFTTARFEEILGDRNETVWVSQNVVGIDGFLRMSANSPAPVDIASDLEITTLYVQPHHHGRGLGKALLKTGLQFCLHTGQPGTWLAVNAENEKPRPSTSRVALRWRDKPISRSATRFTPTTFFSFAWTADRFEQRLHTTKRLTPINCVYIHTLCLVAIVPSYAKPPGE